jgi:hypothetical protein
MRGREAVYGREMEVALVEGVEGLCQLLLLEGSSGEARASGRVNLQDHYNLFEDFDKGIGRGCQIRQEAGKKQAGKNGESAAEAGTLGIVKD